jgi:hypothetical protein
VWSGGGSVVHQAEGRERERERERASSDGLACGCRVQTDQFPDHHQFSKPNILHNFHGFAHTRSSAASAESSQCFPHSATAS